MNFLLFKKKFFCPKQKGKISLRTLNTPRKDHLSTTMCIMSLKQIIFQSKNSSTPTPIYACFLDITKAFDKVNNELMCSSFLPFYWFEKQNFILDGNFKRLNETCGLWQGSFRSPFFNIYLEELSMLLNKTLIGCHINKYFIKHLIYADDLVIFLSLNGRTAKWRRNE